MDMNAGNHWQPIQQCSATLNLIKGFKLLQLVSNDIYTLYKKQKKLFKRRVLWKFHDEIAHKSYRDTDTYFTENINIWILYLVTLKVAKSK